MRKSNSAPNDRLLQNTKESYIKNKQYSPMYNTTFDQMTNEQITNQFKSWIDSGTLPQIKDKNCACIKPTSPEEINSLISKIEKR